MPSSITNAKKFSALRLRSGLDPDEAARALGVSARQLRRYETGDCPVPKLAMLEIERLAAKTRKVTQPASNSRFTFIDLFAGIGGMRLGFEAIGGRCVFTSEWDRFAVETYRANFADGEDHKFAGDITKVSAAEIPPHDVLLAGFPCQPFSLAGVSKKNSLGRPHGFECTTQGTLFFDVQRIIAHHRPKAFLLENVKNLERHDKGRTFAVIMDRLTNELGYQTVEHKIVSARPWVPQKRERIFIAGFERGCDFSFDDLIAFIPPADEHPLLGSVLQSHNEVSSKYTLSQHLWDYLRAYRAKHESNGNGFGYSLFGPNDVTRTLSARYFKDGSEILIEQKGTRPRRLTPVECARLMGFERGDRKWTIPVSDTQAYRQFGNAVVPPVVEAVARAMEPYILAAVRRDARTRRRPSAVAQSQGRKAVA